jgi:hypothetical protein
MSTVAELMIRLDMALTGKSRHEAEHTAKGQELSPWGERIYYLSDGGYSRIVVTEDYVLFVASESLNRVRTAWQRPDVQSIVAEISAVFKEQTTEI